VQRWREVIFDRTKQNGSTIAGIETVETKNSPLKAFDDGPLGFQARRQDLNYVVLR